MTKYNSILWVGAMAWTGVSACDGTANAPLDSTDDTAAASAIGDRHCKFPLLHGSPLTWPETGRMVAQVACPDPQNHWVAFTDPATGQKVDLKAVEAEAREARAARPRLGQLLAQRMASVADDSELEVDVWFAHAEPLGFIGMDKKSPAFATASRGTLREAAAQVVSDLRAERTPNRLTTHRYLDGGPTLETDETLPFVTLTASKSSIERIARSPRVLRVMLSGNTLSREVKPESEAYYDLAQAPIYQNTWGYNGSGIWVANLHIDGPDSTHNLPLVSGSCVPDEGGGNFKCFCPSAPMTDNHHRKILGIIKNNSPGSLRYGLASGVNLISANFRFGGANNCTITGAMNWAGAQGAAVVNFSMGFPNGRSAQNSTERFMDFKVNQTPWPTVVTSAGNDGENYMVSSLHHNGIVVGGARDARKTVRSEVTEIYTGSHRLNPPTAPNWELPHIVAPAVSIDTAGDDPNEIGWDTGTSFAAPQVSAIAAVIKKLNYNALEAWPYVTNAILLVGPEMTVDGEVYPMPAGGGSVDRRTGVGLLNGKISVMAGLLRRSVNQSPVAYGHDYGFLYPSSGLRGPYKVAVGNGKTLRAASWVATEVSCGNPATESNCSPATPPNHFLQLYRTNYGNVDYSWNGSQGYQYVGWKNETGSTKTIEIYIEPISGFSSSGNEFGLAWSTLMN